MFHSAEDTSRKLELLREIEIAANTLDGWIKVLHAVSDVVRVPMRRASSKPKNSQTTTKKNSQRRKS